jgi:hypothetical protein
MKTAISMLCVMMLFSTVHASTLPANTATVNTASARFNDAFTRFNGHRQQNGIMLTWSFTNAANVASFVVQRSYDGAYWETLAELPSGSGVRNQYKDEAVYPGYNHYRIVAVMNDGSVIYSATEIVRIVRNG